MKTTLLNERELKETIDSMNLREAATMQAVCVGIVQQAHDMGSDDCEIHIAHSLLSRSYRINPPLFAQSLTERTPYRFTQSYIGDNPKVLILYCGRQHRPTTFRARVLEEVRQHLFFKAHRSLVPVTYRRHPRQITDYLERELGCRIRHLKKPEHIVWKKLPK